MTYSWEVVVRLRATIFCAALAFLILSQPTQIVELYLIDIEAVASRLNGLQPGLVDYLAALGPMAAPFALGCLTVALLWLASVHLISLAPDHEKWPRFKTAFANGLVVVIALTPILGVLVGLLSARSQLPRIELSNPGELKAPLTFYIWGASLFLAVLACILICLNVFATAFVQRAAHRLFSRIGLPVALAAPALVSLAVVLSPTALPWTLGTISLVFLFIAVLTYVLTSFSALYRRTGYPITAIVVAAGLLFSVLGSNDNHKIDYADGGLPTSLEQGFNDWLDRRGDLAYFAEKGKPYPIFYFYVAAEGGGMYAGYHLASFLARAQDTCPGFAQHLFAISSVSGGSLGAAQFAAQMSRSVTNGAWQACSDGPGDGEHSRKAQEFFRTDFLSPIVAASLFPDLLQRILPFPVGAFDRARGLERAFTAKAAELWGSSDDRNPFQASVQKLWHASTAAPALFLNTTSIEMGARITLSPLVLRATPTALDIATLMCNGNKAIEIPLATSVSLSARSPWLAPAGWFERLPSWTDKECHPLPRQDNKPDGAKRDRLYLVDGGYFENSGLETTLEIVSQLRSLARRCQDTLKQGRREMPYETSVGVGFYSLNCSEAFRHGVEIRTIMVFAKDSYAEQFWGPFADLTSSRPSELGAPLRTLLNTGSARTRAVHVRPLMFDDDFNYLGPERSDGQLARLGRYRIPGSFMYGSDNLYQVMLDGTEFFLPLGWRLSRRSIQNIHGSHSPPSRFTLDLIRRELMGQETDSLKYPKLRKGLGGLTR